MLAAIGARAKMSKPELLLLDEPSMGLAPLVVELASPRPRVPLNKMITVSCPSRTLRIADDHAPRPCDGRAAIGVLEELSRGLITNEKVEKAYLGT